jgi:hypothetical protein
LTKNVALNDLGSLVETREWALGANPGTANFTIGLDTVNHVVSAASASSRVVAMETIDRALQGRIPTIIKLDVEGFESEVLLGAAKTLRGAELKAVLTESIADPVVIQLRAAGFVERGYDPFTRKLRPYGGQDTSNTLFLRDADFVQQRLNDAPQIRVLGTVI